MNSKKILTRCWKFWMKFWMEILDEYPTDDRVIELVPIPDPDCEIIAEKPKEKRQIQQTMTKFLTAKQKK